MKRIVTITMNPALDSSTSVQQVVAEDKLRCRAPSHEPGGGGINVSRAISHLGGESTTVFLAGGPNGELLTSLLQDEGIACSPIRVAANTRNNLVVNERTSDRQYRFAMPGGTVERAEWEGVLSELEDLSPTPDFVVASGSLPPGVPDDFYRRVVKLGSRLGCRVVVDTSGTPLERAAAKGLYLVKPNLREFRQMTGRELHDDVEIERSVRNAVKRGIAEVVLLSLGAGGAILGTAEGVVRFRTPTVEIRSKIGAGDSMTAGAVLSLSRGADVQDAAMYAVAAGAAAVMTPGTELCRKEDTDRLYATLKQEQGNAKAPNRGE
jgi:6-phosphofructokinase 2